MPSVRNYDPKKAHDYYERTKELKGREPKKTTTPSGKSPKSTSPKKPPTDTPKVASERVVRLKAKVASIQGALSVALAELSKKRLEATKTEKANSDGKSTAKEKQSSKEYRDKNQQKLKTEAKAESKKTESKSSSSSSSPSSSTSSSSNSVSSMSTDALESRIAKLNSALKEARSQLSSAMQSSGSMAHAAIKSEPTSNEHFARLRSAERISVKMTEVADFGGYATRSNTPCTDGRIILDDAFKENDGQIVPLVFQHGHTDINNILGHAVLENRPDGVYATAYFNKTANGQNAKEQVRHGDLKFLSIYANQLVEKAQNGLKAVVHGNIRELSLVIAGANPGAYIDNVNIVHGDGIDNTVIIEEALITSGDAIELFHADTATKEKPAEAEEKGLEEILDSLTDEQEQAVNYVLAQALLKHSEELAASTETEGGAPAEGEHDIVKSDVAEGSTDGSADVDAPAADSNGDETEDVDVDVYVDSEPTDEVTDEVEFEDDAVEHAATGTSPGDKGPSADTAWRTKVMGLSNSAPTEIGDKVGALAQRIKTKYKLGTKAIPMAGPANAELIAGITAIGNEWVKTVASSVSPSGKFKVAFQAAQGGTNVKLKIVPNGGAMKQSDNTETGAAVQHANNQEDNSMSHNVFDQAKMTATTADGTSVSLSHADVKGIMEDVVSGNGSLKRTLKEYALAHGIENIEYLFPDAKTLEASPQWNARRMEWVEKVLGAVRKQPFARIKSIVADITGEDARARGYITGNMKNEEFFELAKRETTPQTIYKKQKLDRDDVIDIADMDVIAWLKAEMKLMLDEEIAGAILIGDGRSTGDEDKIKEQNVRPIASDSELYVTTVNVNIDDANSSIEELVDAAIESREFYKGSGLPTFYTSESVIAKFLTVKDGDRRRLYSSLDEVKTVLRVSDIVPVDVLGRVPDVIGIMVNLVDYTIGTDRGGQATMFDDFDLDYNKLRYLLETRLSGALTTPKAALVFRRVAAANVLVTPDRPAFDKSSGVVTIPNKTGVQYKNADTGAVLSAGAQTALAPGATLNVAATPVGNYYFANSDQDNFEFKRNG